MWNERQAIEVFHLLFLRALAARVDPALYVLKGGCNLRFFCKSVRYSEDLDLDIRTMAVATLKNNVERVLAAPAFVQTLLAQQITLGRISSPKQTQTTQRWKLMLRTGGSAHDVPTKIEFSRRAFDAGFAHGPVDGELITRYRLYPVLVQRYTLATAFQQKVQALALRRETQARDLFDLKLLLDAGAGKAAPDVLRKLLPGAIQNAAGIGYDDFAGQVLAYLEPEHQSHYRPRKIWQRMQDDAIAALEALRS